MGQRLEHPQGLSRHRTGPGAEDDVSVPGLARLLCGWPPGLTRGGR